MNALQNPRTFEDWPNRYYPLAIDSLAELQNGCYRLKWEAVPGEGFQTIGARGYLEAQAHLIPDSYIWGWTFDGDSNIEVQITDVATGQKFFSDPTSFGQLAAPGLEGTFTDGGGITHVTRDLVPMIPSLLPKKRLVLPPGKFAFQFWNPNATADHVQFVLWLAEPKR